MYNINMEVLEQARHWDKYFNMQLLFLTLKMNLKDFPSPELILRMSEVLFP